MTNHISISHLDTISFAANSENDNIAVKINDEVVHQAASMSEALCWIQQCKTNGDDDLSIFSRESHTIIRWWRDDGLLIHESHKNELNAYAVDQLGDMVPRGLNCGQLHYEIVSEESKKPVFYRGFWQCSIHS